MKNAALLKAVFNSIDFEKFEKHAPGVTKDDLRDFYSRLKSTLPLMPDTGEAGGEPGDAEPTQHSDSAPEYGNDIPERGKNLLLYTDGAARGNPGPAAIGCVLKDGEGAILQESGKCIGKETNNVAEYSALIHGLEMAAVFKPEKVTVFSDSELLVKQMTGQYRTRDATLIVLKEKAAALIRSRLLETKFQTRKRLPSGSPPRIAMVAPELLDT